MAVLNTSGTVKRVQKSTSLEDGIGLFRFDHADRSDVVVFNLGRVLVLFRILYLFG